MKTKQVLRLLLPTLVLLCGMFALVSCSSQPDAYSITGKPISFKNFIGKWVVINYWADWCKPCITEIPELNELYKQHKKDVVVIGVNYDQLPKQKQLALAKKLHIDYILLASNPAKKLGIKDSSVLPATYIINPNGKLSDALLGPQNQKKLLNEMRL